MNLVVQQDAVRTNKEFYANYWTHPWKYRLMYDTQIKKKLFLFAVRRAGIHQDRKKVLDIGFGSGDILFTFHPSCELYGVDFSPNAVETARRYARKKGYRNAVFTQVDLDTEVLPAADASFDIVICSHVLEHLLDDHRMLFEIHRVLKENGIAVILIPINEKPNEDPNHVRVYTTQNFLHQLERIGFKARLVLEGEYIWHLLGWFFLKGYHQKIPILGRLSSGLVNIPLALMPFRAHLFLDKVFALLGYRPRQAVFCVGKK